MKKFKEYFRLIGFIKPHLWVFIGSAVCMAIATFMGKIATIGAIIPFVTVILAGKKITLPDQTRLPEFLSATVSDFVNYINSLDRLQVLYTLIFGVLVLYFLKEIFTFLYQFLSSKLSLKVVKDIRNKLYNNLIGLTLNFYSKRRAGQLVSRITYDSSIVQQAVSEGLRDMIFETIQLIVLLGALVIIILTFNIPWWFIGIFLLIMPLVVYPVNRLGRRVRSITTDAQEKMSDINSILYETFSGIRIVKAFDMADYERKKFENKNQGFFKVQLKEAKRLAAVNPLTEYLTVVAGILVVYFAGRAIILGGLDPGAFTAFIFCLFELVSPFKKLSKVHLVNQKALSAAGRIFSILDERPDIKEKEGAHNLPELKNRISFEGTSFKYDDEEVLKEINLEVFRGEILAIVGKSGVGKTTLINLIPRFYDPTKGRIVIDGYDIKDVTLDSLRKQIGIVTQETILFNDTIRANIAYGKIGATDEQIREAVQAANAEDFIERLPEKYDTVIGDRGFRLSGGEKQRIAIARAILKNPPILILDEATSQLDTESERLVQNAIDHLIKGRTAFVIAHRLSTVKGASRIMVLDGGTIAESGTHTELMEKDGLYKKLYNLQFKDVE
jgi:ATP-binding cassette, subfamily B, bacterial MsbA